MCKGHARTSAWPLAEPCGEPEAVSAVRSLGTLRSGKRPLALSRLALLSWPDLIQQCGRKTISEIIGEFGRDAGRLATGPFEHLVGYRARLSEAHGAYLELEVEERHMSQYGMAHGGVALVLLDTVGGVHLLAARPELARLVTISLSANFIGPVRPGLVVATAEIQRIGGSVAYTSMALHAGGFDGELLATAHGAYRLFHAPG